MDAYRVVFLVLSALLVGVRMSWHVRAEIRDPGLSSPSEGAWVPFARAIVLPLWLGVMALWVWDPGLLPWLLLPLPAVVRWVGVPVFLAGLALLVWVHSTLGRNFSPYLRIRENHRLVQDGPYQRVRHPMYTSFLLLMAGLALISAHLLLAVTGFGMLLAVIVFRTPREEAMMEAHFGQAYRDYRARTGMLLPRWRSMGRGSPT